MLTIKLKNFSKKINSTKQPTTWDTTVNCTLKDTCSVIAPSVKVHLNSTSRPNYNYSYLMDRYYFIKDWVWEDGLWVAYMECDVLASFKTSILSLSQYVLRSYSSYDNKVVDTFYPSKYDISTSTSTSSTLCTLKNLDNVGTNQVLWKKVFSTGYFYFKVIDSIVTNENDSPPGYTIYVANYESFGKMLKDLSSIQYEDMEDVSQGIARAVANPLQYIIDCIWLPDLAPGTTLGSQRINLGYYGVTIRSGAVVNVNGYKRVTSIAMVDHPQTSRGLYVNMSPYTTAKLVVEPFGTFELAVSDMAGNDNVNIDVAIDIYTGQAILTATGAEKGNLLIRSNAQIGIPVPITQVTMDVVNSAVNAFMNTIGPQEQAKNRERRAKMLAESAYENSHTMDAYVAKYESDGRAYDDSAIRSLFSGAQVSTTGTQGSLLAFSFLPTIYFTFFNLVNEDFTHVGRPLCQEKTLSTLSGYCQCRDGDVEISGATSTELSAISSYLTGGFFIE